MKAILNLTKERIILHNNIEYENDREGHYSPTLHRIVWDDEYSIIEDDSNWSAFRREAAKDAMSGMMANADFWQQIWSENRVDGRCDYPSEIAHFAVACADELIKQLKEQNK